MRAGISGFVDRWMRRLSGRRVCQEDDLEVRNLSRRMRDFLETTEARGRASGDRISGFWSREVVEHVCGVIFIRRSLDVHRSDRERHRLLGCWISTQHRAMVAARCRGV